MDTKDAPIVPSDTIAESQFAALLLSRPLEVLDTTFGRISAKHFQDPLCRLIFDAAQDRYKSEIACDPFEVLHYAQSTGRGKDFASLSGSIAELVHGVSATTAHLQHYVSRLEIAASRRACLRAAQEIRSLALAEPIDNENASSILERAETIALSLRDGAADPDEWINLYAGLRDYVHETNRRGFVLPGIKSGINILDKCLGGFRPGSLSIIAARPSAGKSAMLLQILAFIAQHRSAALFSLEMPSEELRARLVSHISQHNLDIICRPEGQNAIHRLASSLTGKERLFCSDSPRLSMDTLRAHARRLRRAHKIEILAVDYLQLMVGARGIERRLQLAEITSEAKRLAKGLEIPVILLSQLNRIAAETQPRLHHLSESGSIEQDADAVIMIHRPQLSLPDCTVSIEKNRSGPTAEASMFFSGEVVTFSDEQPDF